MATVVAYRARNLVNGHTYIGITRSGLANREHAHRRCAARGEGFRLHNAMRKYGDENFVFEVIADFGDDREMAEAYEIEAIAKYQPEYNMTVGGDGGKVDAEGRAKISAAHKGRAPVFKGRKWTPEALAKLRATRAANGKPAPMLGKKMLPHVREALRLANLNRPSNFKGKKHTPEFRAWLSAYKQAMPSTSTEKHKAAARECVKAAHAATRKRVRCVDDGRLFNSAVEASLHYGFRKNVVSRIITGDIKRHGSGLRFEYVEDES